MILVGVIKDRSSPVGVSRTIGRVIKPKVIGISKVPGVSNNGQVVGKDTVKAHTVKQDTINRDMAMVVIGTTGISSITTTSIGASNNRVVKPLQLAAKL